MLNLTVQNFGLLLRRSLILEILDYLLIILFRKIIQFASLDFANIIYYNISAYSDFAYYVLQYICIFRLCVYYILQYICILDLRWLAKLLYKHFIDLNLTRIKCLQNCVVLTLSYIAGIAFYCTNTIFWVKGDILAT